jgi:hypothetical protein
MNLGWKVAAGAAVATVAGVGMIWWMRKPARTEPVSLGWKVAGAMALSGGVSLGIYRWMHGPARLRGTKFFAGDKGLEGVYEADATVAPVVLDELHEAIDDEALSSRVVDLSPKTQEQAYRISRRLWVETDFKGDKHDLVLEVLKKVAPHTSWHVPRDELEEESARAKVYDGVATLVEIMGASAEEEAREYETQPQAAGGES